MFKNNENVIRKSTKPCRKQGDYDHRFEKNKYITSKHETYLTEHTHIGKMVPTDIRTTLIKLIK